MMTDLMQTKPGAVADLEAAYGPPSRAAFGSAVFYTPLPPGSDLEQAALAQYRNFTGDLWDRYGEEAWLGPWKAVYARPAGAAPDIIAELRAIADPDVAMSAGMILDNLENAEQARAALSAVYDDPALTELRVYRLGDGGAMSGILIAGGRRERGMAVFLLFLLD